MATRSNQLFIKLKRTVVCAFRKFVFRIVYQWLASILAGAVNIEQTASLDFKSLERLLCKKCITSQKQQHTILTKIATEENVTGYLVQKSFYGLLIATPHEADFKNGELSNSTSE